MIAFDCPTCGKHFSFSDRFAGRNMICSGCKSDIVVPEPAEEELQIAPQPEEEYRLADNSDQDLQLAEDSRTEYQIAEESKTVENAVVPPPVLSPPLPPPPPMTPPAPVHATGNSVSAFPPPPFPDALGADPLGPHVSMSSGPPIPPPLPPNPGDPLSGGTLPPDFPASFDSALSFGPPDLGYLPPAPAPGSDPFASLPTASPAEADAGLLAYVFEEKHQDQQQSQSTSADPVPVAKRPEEPSVWKKNLLFWGGIGLVLSLVLGLGLYLILYVDWRKPDERLAVIERLMQQKNQAIIVSKQKETETENLRLRALDQWNAAGETVDAFIMTQGELDDKRLDLLDMDKTLKLHAGNENLVKQLTPKREEIAGAIQIVEERLAKLRGQIVDGVKKASENEISADDAFLDSRLSLEESKYCDKEIEELRGQVERFPNERSPVRVELFDKEKNRISADDVLKLDRDWTEYHFKEFSFPDSPPERFAAVFDGVRRLHGNKSLRISILERVSINLRFPGPENARTSHGTVGFMSFSLRFPEVRDPIVTGHSLETGRIGEMRVRFGNSAGYVQFQTISPRYCESIFYDARGKYITVEFPLEGDSFWQRSDHFDMSKFDETDDSIDSMLAGQELPSGENRPNEKSFFSKIDWGEIRISPLSDQTTLWIDGISLTEKQTRAPYDLLRSETLQKDLREREKDFLMKRRPAPRLSSILSATQGGTPPGNTDEIEFIDPDAKNDKPGDAEKPAEPVEKDAGPAALEFEGTGEERMRKLFRWALQTGNGRIKARRGNQVLSFGPKSTVPDSLDGVLVEEIDLTGFRQLNEDQLSQIGMLKELKRLNLSRTSLKNRDIVKLSALDSLESLNLSGNELSFEAMPALRTLKKLTELNIDDIRTSVDGIDALGQLPALRSLSMSRSGIDGADLTYLLPLADLETLDISSTRIGDRGLTTVRAFNSLQTLNISKTRISNKALESLDILEKLKALQMDGTSLDDGCLEAIGKIPNLESVSALNTKITQDGIRKTLGNAWVGKFKLSPGQ